MGRREKGWGGERRDGEEWEDAFKHHLSIPHSDSLMSLLQLTHTTLVLRA